ncbi:tetratricopeptide repeat domain 27 [Cavenderia fasciculata]|uniref:Tetratricopeptide repeat domain 27 n=1 Tax=Cavenderia fasciculata TaxID=261658 RepID=F4PTV1_CACFS|nr:tetratricopeptide repeat domain 27 [Cavenderia fasciculata]EGG20930.1 tetratricopeptide repeat domain 27 [Cavenderia fasciculata]|eukprot:XP_004358780.1 tetratricopeptide repeat domain 27 [Cavenderia fasciculata]
MVAYNIEDVDQWVIDNNIDKIDELYNKYCKDQSSDDLQDIDLKNDIIRMAHRILHADLYKSITSSPFIKSLIGLEEFQSNPNLTAEGKNNNNHSFESKIDNLTLDGHPLAVLLTGVTLLNLFVQINWTGPTVSIKSGLDLDNRLFKAVKSILEVDGEPVYTKVKHPFLLVLARICLVEQYSYLADVRSACWWSSRCMMIHQRSLSNPTPTIKTLVNERFQFVSRSFANVADNEKNQNVIDMAVQAKLEQSLCYHYYRQLNKTKDSLAEACDISGLSVSLTGALGRRTRYQTFDTAQLILDIKSARERTEQDNDKMQVDQKEKDSSAGVFDENHKFQGEVTNDDITLLSRPKLKDAEHDMRSLRTIDQAILNTLCLNIKNQNPNIGLTTEEMMPYMHKVLQRSNNWMVHSQGLLIKSRLETISSKTVERAALQVQALVDQYDDPTSTAAERLRYIYATDYPSRWDLEKEVGERFVSIGAAATAFDIFERLEMWSDAIRCLTFMGKHARSEELILQRLEIEPTPELWCVLADVRDQPEHYITAWELSKRRYSRAQRSLGHYYIRKEKWDEAIDAYTLALAINPLFPGSWFSLGCASMRVEKWDVSVNAFSRTIALEPEEGEAYGNLASIYMRQGKLDKAFAALQEGIKHRRENWKMWENYLHVCMGLKDYQNACLATLSIFDLAEKRINLHIVQTIANFVIEDSVDRSGFNGRRFESVVTDMCDKLTAKLTNSPDLWALCSDYHFRLGHLDRAIDLQQRACRTAESEQWENSKDSFERVVKHQQVLVNLYLKQDPIVSENIYSSTLKIKSLLKKVEFTYSNTEPFKLLLELQSILENHK